MKKISAILGMITCMFMLAACGGQDDKPLDDFEMNLVRSCESTVNNIEQIVSSGWEEEAIYADVHDDLVNWKTARAEIGEFKGTDGGTVRKTEGEYVVSINISGSKHNATMDFYVDETTMTITNFTPNVIYTTGEKMSKAGLNTLIGMGTVFVVLILISLIISAFGLIAKAQNGSKKKETETADVTKEPVVAQIAEKEELADDTELVAVIAAAIAAYEGSASTDGFVVRSIRKSNKNRWQNA